MKKILNGGTCILFALLISCGSRRVEVNKTTIDTTSTVHKVQESSHLVQENTTTTDNSIIDDYVIEPKDTTKPMVIEGKVYKNAILRHEKKKNAVQVVSVNKKQENQRTETTTQAIGHKRIFVKETDRKESILSYWWILLVIILAWYIWKNYKKLWWV